MELLCDLRLREVVLTIEVVLMDLVLSAGIRLLHLLKVILLV